MSDDGLQSKEKKQGFMERLFKVKPAEGHKTRTEEEILSLVEEGNEKGLIEDDTQSVIENIFDFDDTSVSEIMTHRMDMIALEDTDTLEEVKRVAIESGHSRIPVYQDDADNIVGILYVKDLLQFVGVPFPEHFKLRSILRPVMFVPRTKDLRSLFEEMTKNKTQIAVVVDEYGGTEGIVTLEDLIEDILGNIQDEYDHEEEEIRKIDENRFTVDGSTALEDVEELVGVTLPASDCETVAGLILESLGRIPQDHETPSVEVGGLRLTAKKTEDRRITEVLIEKLDGEAGDMR